MVFSHLRDIWGICRWICKIRYITYFKRIITAHQRSCGRVMFSVVSAHMEGKVVQGPLPEHIQTSSLWSADCRQAGDCHSTEMPSCYLVLLAYAQHIIHIHKTQKIKVLLQMREKLFDCGTGRKPIVLNPYCQFTQSQKMWIDHERYV